ncbi:MAG: ATP-binding protein, partial [Pseudomonadota bacterium]
MISEGGLEALVLLSLLLAGAAIAFAVAQIVRFLRVSEADDTTLIDRLEAAGLPAVLAHLDGRILYLTAPLRQGEEDPSTRIETALGQILEGIDPPVLYRLAQASANVGFALRPTKRREDGADCYLASTRLAGDQMIWSVLEREDLQQSFGEAARAVWGLRQVPALHVTKEGRYEPTEGFIAKFGPDIARVMESLGPHPGKTETRINLTNASGRLNPFCVIALPVEPEGSRILLFLDVESDLSSPGSAQGALELLPAALMQFDLEGRLLWLNQQAAQILGSEHRPGVEIDQIFTALGRPMASLLEEARSGSASRRGAMVRLEGQKSGGFLQISLIRSELDGADSFLAVVNDANELRELEDRFAQSQKMEAVGKLAGGVAHDFNNVLTAIKGHCDFVLMGKEQTHPDYEDLVQIRQNSNRAASMVRHLLAFSRQQTLQPQMLNLRDVISDAHVFLNSVIGERVVLHIDHERDIWTVMADQHQLEQVLMNLVVNARDAMEDGGTVTVATRNVSQQREEMIQGIAVPPGNYVEISVTDDGSGIPEEVIDRVFDPFFTTKPQGQGTGLGLSTVYGIVKQSGGFIFAQNLQDGGACFRLMLPCANPSTRREVTEAPTELRRDLTGQASVLLVEDEDSIRSVGSRALKLRGYHVHEAASAEDAMKLLSEDKITVDVLVSDVVMPGMDGPTFAVRARAIRPGLRLIFVSGYAEDNFNNSELGDDFLFLPKPFSINELTAK